VIDDWLNESPSQETWVACSNGDEKLVAMAQAYMIEPGDWYLRGLRSNPNSSRHEVAFAIHGLVRGIGNFLRAKNAETVRYGTLENYSESLRLAKMLGFREHFRLAHASHPVSAIPDIQPDVEAGVPADKSGIFECLVGGLSIKPADGYFFTWWDTRRLTRKYITEPSENVIVFKAAEGGEMTGCAICWWIPWQRHLVLAAMEGSDRALKAMFREAMAVAHEKKAKVFGMVHPYMDEMHRRQRLFGLTETGIHTVQLILTSLR
jgi:hypothetical protein